MKKSIRRYLFCEFDDLIRVKFKKIEKVCDKLFVFIREEEKYVPVGLVQKMQRFGRNAKWIVVENAGDKGGMQHIMSYVIGKLDERIDGGIEFGILSGDTSFDPLVVHINEKSGRKVMRVNVQVDYSDMKPAKKQQEEQLPTEESAARARSPHTLIDEMQSEEDLQADLEIAVPRSAAAPVSISDDDDDFDMQENGVLYEANRSSTLLGTVSLDVAQKQKVASIAEITVERLERSGNRPALVSTLKNYILLHNEEATAADNIDAVLEKMEKNGKIKVKGEAVRYNF